MVKFIFITCHLGAERGREYMENTDDLICVHQQNGLNVYDRPSKIIFLDNHNYLNHSSTGGKKNCKTSKRPIKWQHMVTRTLMLLFGSYSASTDSSYECLLRDIFADVPCILSSKDSKLFVPQNKFSEWQVLQGGGVEIFTLPLCQYKAKPHLHHPYFGVFLLLSF